MNNLNLPYPKRIDESLLANLDCGVTEEQINEAVCTMEKIKQLSENPSEDVLLVDVRTPRNMATGTSMVASTSRWVMRRSTSINLKPMKRFISSVALAGVHATQPVPSTTKAWKTLSVCQLPVCCIGIRPVIQ